MNKIAITIQEVEETIAILEVQKGDASFEEAGGLMQIESEKIKLVALREKLERDKGCGRCNNLRGSEKRRYIAEGKPFCPCCGKRLEEAK